MSGFNRRFSLIIAFAILIIVAFAVYYPGAKGPYILDDFRNLANNTKLQLKELTIPAITGAVLSVEAGPLYRPVAKLSFALNYYLAGSGSPYPVKVTNIFIHILTACGIFLLTFLLLERLEKTKGEVENSPDSRQRRWWVALFITGLWLLHPLHVSTVLYAVQRMTELSALFSIYAAVTYVRGRNELLRGNKTGFWWILWGVIGGGAFAVLSKENGGLLPLLLLVIEGIFYRFDFHAGINRSFRYIIYGILILPSLGIFSYLIGSVIVSPGGLSWKPFTLVERLLTESRVLFYYLRLILLPDISAMGMFHDDFGISRGLLTPLTTLLSVIGLLIIVIVGIHGLARRRFPVISFAILWYLGWHLLESSVVQLDLVFEHRNYLPIYGPIFAVGYYVTHRRLRTNALLSTVRYIIPAVMLTLLAILVQTRVGHWSSSNRFLINEVRNHPESARAWSELAYNQVNSKAYKEAIISFQNAAEKDRRETGYLLAIFEILGYWMREPIPEALVTDIENRLSLSQITTYTTVQLSVSSRNSLIMAHSEEEDKQLQPYRTIVKRFLHASTTNPLWPSDVTKGAAWFFLGEIHYREGLIREAINAYEKASYLVPDAPDPRLALARSYLSLNEIPRAEEQLRWFEDKQLNESNQADLIQLREWYYRERVKRQ